MQHRKSSCLSPSEFCSPRENMLYGMKTYKLLTGLTVASFFVFITAFFCSEILETGSEWYKSLDKPSFLLSDGYMSLTWFLAYLGNILCFGRLVSKKTVYPEAIFGVAVWVFAVLFLVFFFRLHNVAAGFVAMLFTFFAALAAQARFLYSDVFAGICYLPMTATVVYCFLLSVQITF